ncbi:MAG: TnpV protein, partial [Blautia sp.]|nr:TnpV protein [Blautia sp.]
MAQSMKVTYQRKGDYLFPNLMTEPGTVTYGKYGMLRERFLKENRKNWYQSMMLSGKLENHLQEIDQRADERMERIVSQMAMAEGMTEKLKGDDPMAWIARMNNIRNRAEETVLEDLIYNEWKRQMNRSWQKQRRHKPLLLFCQTCRQLMPRSVRS